MIKNLPRIWLSTCGRTWGQRTEKSIVWNQRKKERYNKDVTKEKAAMETERTSSRLYMWASTAHYIHIINSLEFRAETFFFSFYFSLFPSFLSFYPIPISTISGSNPISSTLWPTNKQNHLHYLERERERETCFFDNIVIALFHVST